MKQRFRAVQEFKELQRALITNCLTKRERLHELLNIKREKTKALQEAKLKVAQFLKQKTCDVQENFYDESAVRRLDVLEDARERKCLEKYSKSFKQYSLNLNEINSVNEIMRIKISDYNKSMGGANVLSDTIAKLKRENDFVQVQVASLKCRLNADLSNTKNMKAYLEASSKKERLLHFSYVNQTNDSLKKTMEIQSIVKRLDMLRTKENDLIEKESKALLRSEKHLDNVRRLERRINERKTQIEKQLVKAQKIRHAIQKYKFRPKRSKSKKSEEDETSNYRIVKDADFEKCWKQTSYLKGNLANLQKNLHELQNVFELNYKQSQNVSSVLVKMISIINKISIS